MLAFSSALLSWLAGRFRGRVGFELEVIALRPPLAVLSRPHLALRVRSPTLGLALPGLAAEPERHAVGEAGDRGPVAPSRLSALLARALKFWTAVSRSRSS